MAEKHLRVPSPGGTPCASPCNTDLYQEETFERGGAAVAKMMLCSQKVGLDPMTTFQTDLYTYANSHNLATEPANLWDVDPMGLRTVLRDKKPPAFGNTFNIYTFTNDQAGLDAANAKIIYTIDNYEVAPAALVAGGTQWVAVVGYKTDGAGHLTDIFLNDPRPPVSEGTGDPPDFQVAASTWDDNNYFNAVDGGVEWNNKRVLVVDPEEPKGELPTAVEKPLFDGRDLINPDEAIKAAFHLLRERGAAERPLFARALEAGQPAAPHLVQVSDREDTFYYLVRIQVRGEDLAVIALDARFGTFLEAIAYHKPLRFFALTPEEVPGRFKEGLVLHENLENVRDRIIQRLQKVTGPVQPAGRPASLLPGVELAQVNRILAEEIARARRPQVYRRFRTPELSVHPVMVWQPSAESISRLYPSYSVATPRGNYLVRAADGLIYDQFTHFFALYLGG
jgi:hypothetical protein